MNDDDKWRLFGFIAVCIILIALLFFEDARGEDITLTWTNPTTVFVMTDAGPYTNPAGTRIYLEVAEVADPTSESVTLPAMKPGTYRFVAVSYDNQGVSSPVSTAVEKTVTGFSVTDERAYIVAKTRGAFLLLVVGTVPIGTPCDPDTEVNGKNAVDADLVTFTGVRDVVVVAQCG